MLPRLRSVVRRLLVGHLALVLAAGALHAQDDDGDELFPGGIGGMGGLPSGVDPTEPKRREWTSMQLLKWEWEPGLPPSHGDRKELPEKEALTILADGDPRPLLILRECAGCDRDDHGVVTQEIENERTILLGRWFHPVRVDDEVLAKTHPFHAFFGGNTPPHLVAATVDGSMVSAVATRGNGKALGKTLSGVLRKAYRKDPDATVKSLLVLLDEFDRVDKALRQTDDKLAALRKELGADAREVKAMEEERKGIDDERHALLLKGEALADLGLEPAPGAPPR